MAKRWPAPAGASLEADREIIEEWKWMGSRVWSHDGMIAVGNARKEKVKLTFPHGASLPDPDKMWGGQSWPQPAFSRLLRSF